MTQTTGEPCLSAVLSLGYDVMSPRLRRSILYLTYNVYILHTFGLLSSTVTSFHATVLVRVYRYYKIWIMDDGDLLLILCLMLMMHTVFLDSKYTYQLCVITQIM